MEEEYYTEYFKRIVIWQLCFLRVNLYEIPFFSLEIDEIEDESVLE